MDYGITVEDARLERQGAGRNVQTPWEQGWRRRAYEQLVPRFWPYLLDGQGARTPDPHLDGKGLMERFAELVEEFSQQVPAEQQEEFLNAMGFRFEETPAPIEPDCRCHWCAYLRLRAQIEASIPRQYRLQEQFLRVLIPHLELVLKAPNAYDRRHGVPRLSWRGRRSHTNREQCA